MQVLTKETVQKLENLHTEDYPMKEGLIGSLDMIAHMSCQMQPIFPETDSQNVIRSFTEVLENADIQDVQLLEYDIAVHILDEVEPHLDCTFFSADSFASQINGGWLLEALKAQLYSKGSMDRSTTVKADQLFYQAARTFNSHTGRMPSGGERSNFVEMMKVFVADEYIRTAMPSLGGVRDRCQTAIKKLKTTIKQKQKAERAIKNLSK